MSISLKNYFPLKKKKIMSILQREKKNIRTISSKRWLIGSIRASVSFLEPSKNHSLLFILMLFLKKTNYTDVIKDIYGVVTSMKIIRGEIESFPTTISLTRDQY